MVLNLDPYEYAKHLKHHNEPDDRCVLCIYEPDKAQIAMAILGNLENIGFDVEALFGEQPELDTLIDKLYSEAEEDL